MQIERRAIRIDMSLFSKISIMNAQPRWRRLRLRVLLSSVIALFTTIWLLSGHKSGPVRISDETELKLKFPYTYKHIHAFKKGLGGGKFDSAYCQIGILMPQSYPIEPCWQVISISMAYSPKLGRRQSVTPRKYNRSSPISVKSRRVSSRAPYSVLEYSPHDASKMGYHSATWHKGYDSFLHRDMADRCHLPSSGIQWNGILSLG